VPAPNDVRGLPPAQASEAVLASARLSDIEIFVLMSCLHVGKSRSLGVFRRAAIERRPSIARPLIEAGCEPARVTKSLIEKGFLTPAGFGRLATSADGEIIKHRFSILLQHLRLSGVLPPAGIRISDVAILRERMRRVGDGTPI
jgi:hypothetical protein